jgi:serine/threonine protein kinase/Flp pilus assembly protein TadD
MSYAEAYRPDRPPVADAPGSPAGASADDPRVVAALEEYVAALEAGEPLDCRSFVARYPDIAGALAACLAGLEFVQDAGAPLRQPATACAPEGTEAPALPMPLGDFRLLREVGRGGMGVVYEAQQLSLGRRVAVKILPFAGALDAKQLQRFKNEAQAAANLTHQHIVPVHYVGCERGIHFYAMQYIDGQTLAQVIAGLRRSAGDQAAPAPAEPPPSADTPASRMNGPEPPPTPDGEATCPYDRPPRSPGTTAPDTVPQAGLATERSHRTATYFRTVARLGEQAAEALHHAHEMGVVHRDVKPGNLLLDGRGNVWVTDFGLARMQTEASLTLSGDLVGTVRYMSHEQALANRVTIDHRTDVYSLGATLYELLVLRPAFAGSDRQELLLQIAFDEPVSPRRLNNAVPVELETVLLKAMEKRAEDRYATAQALAEDLRRFLEDKPIWARRPTLAQRLRKWGRRHRAAAWAGVGVFVVAALVGGAIWVWWAQKRAGAEGEARAALREATQLQEQERWVEAQSAVKRAQGVLAGVGADADLRQEVEELAKDFEMARRLEEARLKNTFNEDKQLARRDRNAAYVEAFTWYGLDVENSDPEQVAERIRSRSIRMQLTAGLDDWGHVRKGLGRGAWQPLVAVARAADPDPWRNRLRDALEGKDPRALEELVSLDPGTDVQPATACVLAKLTEGTPIAKRAVVFMEKVQQKHPSDFLLNYQLGWCIAELRPSRWEKPLRYYTAAVALRPQNAGAHHGVAIALHEMGHLDGAIAEYREAIRLKKDWMGAHENLGIALRNKGQLDEAIVAHQEGIRLKKDDAGAHNNLGVDLLYKGHVDQAIAEFQEAIRLKKNYAMAHNNLGNALNAKGLLDDAVAEYRQAIRLNKEDPVPHSNLADALQKKGESEEAIAECREAIRLKKGFADAHFNLGAALQAKGRLDEAIAEYRETIRLKEDFALAHSNLGNALFDKGLRDEGIAEHRLAIRLKPGSAEFHYNLGCDLHTKGLLDEAVAEYREAIRLKKDKADAYCNLGQVLRKQGKFLEALPPLCRGHQLGSKDPRWPYPSARWVRDCELFLELGPKLPAVLRGQQQPQDAAEWLGFARLCQHLSKKLYAAASRFYRTAFTANPKLAEDVNDLHRYSAACAAALAGCGRGEDTKTLDDTERARLRQQALAWLRDDLEAWRKLVKSGPDKTRHDVAGTMKHWQTDADFAGVRAEQALARLPQDERQAWRKLWADVAETLAESQAKIDRHKKPGSK